MVIISNYLKSVCLRDSLSLVRPDTGLPARPVYSLASCYCFCRSVSMNSPFRVRLRNSRPPASASPRHRPPGRPGHPPLSVWGCKSTSFFRTAKLFQKNFSKFSKNSVPSFLHITLTPLSKKCALMHLHRQNPSYTNTCYPIASKRTS